MTTSDWTYITKLSREQHVTLAEARVKRTMTLGQSIDWVLDAAMKANRAAGGSSS